MSRKLFLDTAYAIALSSVRDRHHEKALELATSLEEQAIPLVTTPPSSIANVNIVIPQRSGATPIRPEKQLPPSYL